MAAFSRAVLPAVLLMLASCGAPGCGRENWRGPTAQLEETVRPASVDPAALEAPPVVSAARGTPPPSADVPEPASATGHPRLWLRPDDLPRLRAWAVPSNVTWTAGVLRLAEAYKAEVDQGAVPHGKGTEDCTDDTGVYPCEAYMATFAFMSLVHPDEGARAAYAGRARTLLMRMMNEAAKGKTTGEGRGIRHETFPVDDRSRWTGEAFALTVDWIYPHLSKEDKGTIRKVFLRWCEENVRAETTNHNHPEPIGTLNDPVLVKDRAARRFAMNNYFTAHMRNLTLMSLALDAEDDAGGKLRAYLKNALGAWLYMIDFVLKNDARGGLGPEGFEYGPQTLSYVLHALIALETAGEVKPSQYGAQVGLGRDRFWDDALTAYFHAMSPAPVPNATVGLGEVYQPAWYGDGQQYYATDRIDYMGPLALLAQLTHDSRRLKAARFIAASLGPGGAAGLGARLKSADAYKNVVFYFLTLEPGQVAEDPRATVPLAFWSPGLGFTFARTSWNRDATWFYHQLGWIEIDHQHAEGNNFGFYRRGEWLTKKRVGYGDVIGSSDSQNTMTIENKAPFHNDKSDFRHQFFLRGSQWINGGAIGDPRVLAQSAEAAYVYALGDATNLYNSEHEEVYEVTQAARSIVWLKPDHVVIYDRAATKGEGKAKKFWLQLPAMATVSGDRATMTTARGQKLYVSRVLPDKAVMKAEAAEKSDEHAAFDDINFRLVTSVPAKPKEVRFLHVLQGADGAVPADAATPVPCTAGGCDAVLVKSTVLVFPHGVAPMTDVAFTAPAAATSFLVTGLAPNAAVDVSVEAQGDRKSVRVRPGRAKKADGGGVLAF